MNQRLIYMTGSLCDNNQCLAHMNQCLSDVDVRLGHAYQGLGRVDRALGDNNFYLVLTHLGSGVLPYPLVFGDAAHDDLHNAHFCPAWHGAQGIDQKFR